MKNITRILALAVICGAVLCRSAAGQGETRPGESLSPRDQLIRDAYAAIIRADMARDEKRYEDSVELYVLALDLWGQLSTKHPGFRAGDVDRNTAYCRNEARSLMAKVDLMKPIGDKLKRQLDDRQAQPATNSPVVVQQNGPEAASSVSKGYSEEAMRLELERLRNEMFEATRREAIESKRRSDQDAKDRAREAADLRRDGEATRKQNEEALKEAEAARREKEAARKQAEAAKKQTDEARKQSEAARRDTEAAIAATKAARKQLEEVNRRCNDLQKQKLELEAKLTKMGDVEQAAQSEKAQKEATEQLLAKIDKENKALVAEKNTLEDRVDRLEDTLMSTKDGVKKAPAKKGEKVAATPDGAKKAVTNAARVAAVPAPAEVKGVDENEAKVAEDIKTSNAVAAECTRLMRAGQGDKAYELVMYGLAKSPNNPQLQLMLGTLHVNAGRLKDAVDLMTPLVNGEQGTAKARVVLGAALFGLGNVDAARMELEMALGLDPDLSEAHYNYAQLLLHTKPPDPVRARNHYKEAVTLGAEPDPALDEAIKKAMGDGSGK